MKPRTHSSHHPLFPLTQSDLRRIDIAIEQAIRFMQRYGQGRQPRDICSEHYINTRPGLFMLIPKP